MTFKLRLQKHDLNYYELAYPENSHVREKTVSVPNISICDVCGQENIHTISFDSSHEGHRSIDICRDCLLLLAKECEEAK